MPFDEKRLTAYTELATALWRTVCRSKKTFLTEPPACWFKLMNALSETLAAGNICLPVRIVDYPELFDNEGELTLTETELKTLMDVGLMCDRSELTATEAPLGAKAAVVIDRMDRSQARLYLLRQYREEWALARKILAFTQLTAQDSIRTSSLLTGFLRNGQTSKEQAEVIERVLPHGFAVITGGPGTGKTSTVAKLLECALDNKTDAVIGLAAPTGKASGRVMESVLSTLDNASDKKLFSHLSKARQEGRLKARTIHKWLVSPTSAGTRPSKTNPLEVDYLVVDEASMIDLHLALRLFDVIDSKRTQVILLGDRYQLAAVGPGSVFADLTDPAGALKDCVGRLTKSYRFDEKSRIGLLAAAINSDKPFDETAFRALFDKQSSEEFRDRIRWERRRALKVAVHPELVSWIKPFLDELLSVAQQFKTAGIDWSVCASKLFRTADRFRVLAAQREGPDGVNAINQWAEEYMKTALGNRYIGEFYPGRLIIVRANNDELNVFNGDVGVVVPVAGDANHFEVIFDAQAKRRLSVGLLPAFDPAYAMTIHQSQGSEFDHVAVILPHESDSPMCTRELFYTGVTRAKREVFLLASPLTVRQSVTHKTERFGGLATRLKDCV